VKNMSSDLEEKIREELEELYREAKSGKIDLIVDEYLREIAAEVRLWILHETISPATTKVKKLETQAMERGILGLLYELAESLSPEQRLELVKIAVEKAGGVRPLARATLLSKSTISRYLSGEQMADAEAIKKLLIPLVLRPKILADILTHLSKKYAKLGSIISSIVSSLRNIVIEKQG